MACWDEGYTILDAGLLRGLEHPGRSEGGSLFLL